MRMSAERRAAISAGKMGHSVSAETKAKISAAVSAVLIGRPVSMQTRKRIASAQAGARGHNWRGAQVGYGGAHKRHRASLPLECAHCGTVEGRLDVALRSAVPESRLVFCEKRGRCYSVDPADYLRLCRSCHVRYDRDALART